MSRSKYQKFEALEIARADIKNAPYNPRTITDKARKMLRKNIKSKGLLETLVWNKRTGNLVSGHQRISILDDLEGNSDYTLTVAVVDLDEKAEVEQNIFFNSTTPQGVFDLDALQDMIDGGLDWDAAGFDAYDLNIIGIETSELTDATDDDLDALNASYDDRKQAIKDAKEAQRSSIDDRFDEGEKYVNISFPSYAAKVKFMQYFGFPPDNMFIQGHAFTNILNERIEDGQTYE